MNLTSIFKNGLVKKIKKKSKLIEKSRSRPSSKYGGDLSPSSVRLLWPHALQPARLLCPWDFSRQEYRNGLPSPFPGYLPTPGIEPGSPALQVVSCIAGRTSTNWAIRKAQINFCFPFISCTYFLMCRFYIWQAFPVRFDHQSSRLTFYSSNNPIGKEYLFSDWSRRNPGIKISAHTWAWTNYCGQVDPLGGEGRKEFSCSSRRVERGGYPKENWNLSTKRRIMGQKQ